MRFRLLLPLFLLAMSAATAGQPLLREGYRPSFGELRDTLWVLDSTYLEVRLDQQMIYQHFRSGKVDRYPCSTGTPAIADGIATRKGIFTVQSRAARTLSAAFQVYLNYWIGFDGGIGFHGLDGRSYYRFLGRRPSSHGCVRISNETGRQLFRQTPLGTIVYVHDGAPARLLRFADPNRTDLVVMERPDEELLERRLTAVEERRWDDPSLATPLALEAKRRFRKIEVGRTLDAEVQLPLPVREDPEAASFPRNIPPSSPPRLRLLQSPLLSELEE